MTDVMNSIIENDADGDNDDHAKRMITVIRTI